jgi:5-enolpyruvylshikimate-3-phosphate synthase
MATRFDPADPLRGALRPPADKSISHRAALIAAMGEGETTIEGYLDSADTRSTLAAMQAIGATVEGVSATEVDPVISVGGVGLLGPSPARIDVGNAGTLLRLLPGWLAGQPEGRWTLDGDDSIRRRPVDRIAVPLRQMGAKLSCRDDRLPPLEVEGAELSGIEHELPMASAQVKSCLLFAGLLAEGPTWVREPARSRDHTERMLSAAGVDVVWLRWGSSPCPPTSPRLPSSSSRPCSCPTARSPSRVSAQTRPGPVCSASSSGWAPRSRSSLWASAAASRLARSAFAAPPCAALRSAAPRFR